MLTAYQNPVLLAKAAATLDVLSGGRLTLGVSIGGTEAEYRSIGVPIEQRVGRLLENVRIMRRLWAGEDVTYEGRYYSIKGGNVLPKPVQQPIPIYFGNQREAMLDRIGRLADGWVSSAGTSIETFLSGVKRVRAVAAERGRDPDGLGFAKLQLVSIGRDKVDAAEKAHKQWDAYYGRVYNVEGGVTHGTIQEVEADLRPFLDAEAPEVTLIAEPPGLDLAQLELLLEATQRLRA
jgi:alkanesulfonate monooxygenase SsuD/methylene tetrahydromethanopterin reductase-like flavin-dependent oxidoreductase (luciferase family)